MLRSAMSYHGRTKEHGVQALIATDAGVTKASVSDWKRGNTYPKEDILQKLAALYGVSLNALSGYESGNEPENETLVSLGVILNRSTEMTEAIIEGLLPNGTSDQFLMVVRRINELIIEGKNDDEVHGILFRELRRANRDQAE